MAKKYTHTFDYTQFESCFDSIAAFEQAAAQHLVDTVAEDVGAVVLYTRSGEEVAYYDYENYVGSVYALGGTRSDEC